MAKNFTLTHERVDDIPLLVGLARRIRLSEFLDLRLGNHGHHQGLSNGWVGVVWLAYILSQGDHHKSSVEDWAWKHRRTLEKLLGQPLRRVDFSDDRLGIVLHRLSQTPAWYALETDLWQSTVVVYEIEVMGVRLDSTTTYGYHAATEDGLMQHGHSKDHRPDLPQLKLMAAAAEPSGHWIAGDVAPGQSADDPLYPPLIARVRQVLGRSGLLYTGDCKMAALATRADIAAHHDYYLVPLPLTEEHTAQLRDWLQTPPAEGQATTLVWNGDKLIGGGYEFERQLSAEVDGKSVVWTERVQLVYSSTLACQQATGLEQRLLKAEAELRVLTPTPGRGHRRYREPAALEQTIAKVLARYDVTGLLQVTWSQVTEVHTHYIGRGRGGPNRETRTETIVRYAITQVERDAAAIAQHQQLLGWRILVTNLPVARLTLPQTILHYRQGWCLERDFHLLKDVPIGISPLYVRRDDQILGLTRLLTLALRLLTLLEIQTRRGLAQESATLAGLYPGQPTRITDHPTGVRLLKAVAQTEITLTQVDVHGETSWHITPLPVWIERVLGYLGLSPALYTNLADNSP
jgi:transposase